MVSLILSDVKVHVADIDNRYQMVKSYTVFCINGSSIQE